jgi:hypothetical protein
MECYVCRKRITDKEASVYIPGGLRRHESCQAGSPAWLASEAARASSIFKHYRKEESHERQ